MTVPVIILVEDHKEEALIPPEQFELKEGDYEGLNEAVAYMLGTIDAVAVWGEQVEKFRVILYYADWIPFHDTGYVLVQNLTDRVTRGESWEDLMSEFATAIDMVCRAKKVFNAPTA